MTRLEAVAEVARRKEPGPFTLMPTLALLDLLAVAEAAAAWESLSRDSRDPDDIGQEEWARVRQSIRDALRPLLEES